MFDIGFWELCLIGVVALLILGPERLPTVARTAGLWVGRARRFMADVKADIDNELKSEELRAIKDIGADLKDASRELDDVSSELNENVVSDDTLAEAINESAGPENEDAADQPAESGKARSKENADEG
jgi:sec-independent protein translocase protein TatB